MSKQVNFLLSIFLISNLVYALLFVSDLDPATNIKTSLSGLFIGQGGHLWYISSSILGYLLLQYAAGRFSDRLLLIVALVVLGVITLTEGYATLVQVSLPYEVSHMLTSIPFLWCGYLLGKHHIITRYGSVGSSLALLFVGFGLQTAEAILLYKVSGASPHNQEMLLGTTLFALGIFGLSLTFQMPQENLLAAWGRRFSLQVYLYHVVILTVLYGILRLGDLSHYMHWISPIAGFGVCLVVMMAMERLTPRIFRVLSGG